MLTEKNDLLADEQKTHVIWFVSQKLEVTINNIKARTAP